MVVDGSLSITYNIRKLIGRKPELSSKANSLPSQCHSQDADHFVDAANEEGVITNSMQVDRTQKGSRNGKN